MKVNQIFINLPVKDLAVTREFWTSLGFTINEMFSDDKGICVVFNEQSIFAMFLKEEFFQTFSKRPIAKGDTTQVLNAFDVNSRAEVDATVQKAIESGGLKYDEPRDHGWMYQHSFADPDGHQWEVFYGDLSQLPQP